MARPHGVRGEVCVEWYAEDASLIGDAVFLEFPNVGMRSVGVDSWRPHKGGLLVRFGGVNDRNAAEDLRGASVWIPKDRLPELGEGEAYVDDLVGRSVETADGVRLGVLHHIETPAGQMLWAMRDGEFETLFPALPQFIVSLGDPIVLDPPEGLLEACRTKL